MKNTSSHAVAVLIETPVGIPLILDPKKPTPHFWKLPGGRSEGEETPEECAVREISQELGLTLDIDSLELIEQQDRGSHMLTFFKVSLPTLAGLKKVGDEQEEIKVFSPAELKNLPTLFPNHRAILDKKLFR